MASPSIPYKRRWQALVVLSASLLIVSVGNTILNLALPSIRDDLDATSSQLQWIVDGYMLVFAGLLLVAGSLGDRFGRRRSLVSGLIVFALGSVFAALSANTTELIASRAVMGVGAAAIMPVTLSVITNIFPAQERSKAISVWAAVAGLGIAIGPLAGGWLIEHTDWHGVFLANVPVAVLLLLGSALVVPESRDPHPARIDLGGAVLSVAGLSALVYGLIEAPERGWTDPLILSAFAGGALILAAFVAWELRIEQPMLQIKVFRNARFSAASASIAFVYFALMGVMYINTTYLQTVLGYSAFDAGLRILAAAVGMMLASRPSVALARRLGTKPVVAAGLALVAGAFVLLSGLDVDSGDRAVCLTLGLMGLGVGLAMAPATEAIMGALPPEKAGIGSAMNDVVREVAGTFGVAVLGSLLSSAYAGAMDGAVGGLPGDAAATASDSVGAAHALAAQVGGSAGAEIVGAADSAFVDALATTSLIAAGIALAGALIAALLLPSRVAAAVDGQHAPDAHAGGEPLPAAA
jgi:EmrB/QacA subfamily drug resistance transporter